MPPKILKRLVTQLMNKGYDKQTAFAIATKGLQKSGNLKKGTQKPTKKGIAQGKKTPSQRAKERAAKKSNRKPSDYVYNKKTNTAKLKKKK
jgi:hypothetical protein|tara:strand:+ start:295 stop:567 length:273 start_codon:yes stop_codon:yes gene_type:complete